MSIQFKRSTVSGVLPSATNMYQGELALNLPDKKIYTLDNNNAIINIGFSKEDGDNTYFPFTGGALTGPIELYSTQPYIDFHYNNSTADYTSRIIATSASTLQIQSTNVGMSGTLSVTGALSSANFTSAGTAAISSTITAGGLVKAPGYRANSGTPVNDASTVGYTFDYNGDTGVFYENATTQTYGGTLVLQNDGTICMSLVGSLVSVVPQMQAQNGIYTGTSVANSTAYINNGIIELYSGTPAIDFYFNNSQADFTSRIIATDTNTLQLQSATTNVTGVLLVQGTQWNAGNITSSGQVQGGYIVSTGDVHANGNLTAGLQVQGASVVSTGSMLASGHLELSGSDNSIYMTGSSLGRITFNDAKDPDGGIYNYTLMMDNGAITFNYSTSATKYDLGTAKHTFYSDGRYQSASSVIVGSATIQTDGNIYMPWAGDWLSNKLNSALNKSSTPTLGGLQGWPGDQTAPRSGVMYVKSNFNAGVAAYINGTEVQYTSARDKYGTGNCSFSFTFSTGDWVQIRGQAYAYVRYFN